MNNNSSCWYKEGLRFQCTQCGKCCCGFPGYTWVTLSEMEAISHYLQISLEQFVQKYVRKVGDRWSFLEKKENFSCIFLEDKKCRIYPVRPKQCLTFPWWGKNLESSESWEKLKSFCPGIRDDAPLISFEEIQKDLA